VGHMEDDSGSSPSATHQRSTTMRNKFSYLTPLLAAGAPAVAISAAPIASAASAPLQQSCTETVLGSECETPGNVEINDTPAPMNFAPYGDDGFLIGGFGGDGGFHGGGFHGGGGHR
jgi:hypothetical protein